MRNVSSYNYRNSSFIVDLAIGQIPRSTERISSCERFGFVGSTSRLSERLFLSSGEGVNIYVNVRVTT